MRVIFVSSNDLQEKLLNTNNLSAKFFFSDFGIDFNRIADFDFILEANEGVEVINMANYTIDDFSNNWIIRLVRENKHINISSYETSIFLTQIFIDQFGYQGRALPVFSKEQILKNAYWQYDYMDYSQLEKAMKIMLRPLNDYNDFIDTIRAIELFQKRTIIHPDMVLGNIKDWTWGDIKMQDGLISIHQVGTSEWQLVDWERGNPKLSRCIFFCEQAIYTWFVNWYLRLF